MRKSALVVSVVLASFLAGVDGKSCRSCAQTVQQVTTSSKEYGSSLRANPIGGGGGSISVSTRIPYASLDGRQPAAKVRRYSSGPQSFNNSNLGAGFGINPLLRSGAAFGPVISQPVLPSGFAPRPTNSKPQAYNPYTGKVYGQSGSGTSGTNGRPQSGGSYNQSQFRNSPPPASANYSSGGTNAASVYRENNRTARNSGSGR